MATPPIPVSFGASTFSNTTAPKTVSVTVQTGDIITVVAVGESASSPSTTAPTGGSLTYAQQASIGSTASHARAIAWTATAASGATFSVSASHPNGGSGLWGVMVWVDRGSDGVGAVGAPAPGGSNTVTLTTLQANSALRIASADWAAADGTTRTRRTVNGSTGTEDTYFRDAAAYAVYGSRYADAGAAGSVTGGYSAPAAQASAIIGIEIKGAAGAAGKSFPFRRNPGRGLIMRRGRR